MGAWHGWFRKAYNTNCMCVCCCRLTLNSAGGQCLDEAGARVHRWSWNSPSLIPTPLHPVFLSLNKTIGVRILGKEKVFVTFLAKGQQARFRVGACCAQVKLCFFCLFILQLLASPILLQSLFPSSVNVQQAAMLQGRQYQRRSCMCWQPRLGFIRLSRFSTSSTWRHLHIPICWKPHKPLTSCYRPEASRSQYWCDEWEWDSLYQRMSRLSASNKVIGDTMIATLPLIKSMAHSRGQQLLSYKKAFKNYHFTPPPPSSSSCNVLYKCNVLLLYNQGHTTESIQKPCSALMWVEVPYIGNRRV